MKVSFTETIIKSSQTINQNIKFYSALVLLFLLENMALIGVVTSMDDPSFLVVILYRLIDLALYVKLAVTGQCC